MSTPLEFPFDAAQRVGMTWPITRTPMQSSLVQVSASGKEYRQALFPYPRWKWKLDFGYLWDDYSNSKAAVNYMWQTLAGFYNTVQGQRTSFLYMDPWDNTAVSGVSTAAVIASGTGAQTLFPVYKTQQGGVLEPVQWLPNGWSVYLNGTLQTSGVALIQQQPAIFVFTTPPGAGVVVSWTGQFFYLCRFTTDSYDFTHEWYGMYMAKQIEFQSVFC